MMRAPVVSSLGKRLAGSSRRTSVVVNQSWTGDVGSSSCSFHSQSVLIVGQQGGRSLQRRGPTLYNNNNNNETPFMMMTTTRSFWSFGENKNDSQDEQQERDAEKSITTTGVEEAEPAQVQKLDSDTDNVHETLDRIFEQSRESLDIDIAADEAASQVATTIAAGWEPTWYNVADQAVVVIHFVHESTGFNYGLSIITATVALRICLFPLMAWAMRSSSRMAHLQPELKILKDRYDAIGKPTLTEMKQFQGRMKALFQKYEARPMFALIAPLVQIPCFMGMFFGLQKMPKLLPDEFTSGGMLWFIDLSAADPLFVLPMASSVAFAVMTEMNKDQLLANKEHGRMFLNFSRAFAIFFTPFLMFYPSSTTLYWAVNNSLTMVQMYVLKHTVARRMFGIWELPKPVPQVSRIKVKDETLFDATGKLWKEVTGANQDEDKNRMKKHNRIIDSKRKGEALIRKSRRDRRNDAFVDKISSDDNR